MNQKTENIIRIAFPVAGLLLTIIGLNCVDNRQPTATGYGYALVAGVLILCTAYAIHFRNKKE
jgi:hypothetical protein